MSAYIVDDCHITAILNSLAPRYPGDSAAYVWDNQLHYMGGRHHELGQILVDQNVRSVNYRYKDNTPTHVYRSDPRVRSMSPVEVISLCNGYNYQSCETPDYYDTEAHAIVNYIRERAIRNLPGMEDAPWTIYASDLDARDQELKHRRREILSRIREAAA